MKRTTIINLVVDAMAALAVLGLLSTGILLRFVLPPRSGRDLWLWGLDRHEWGDVHLFLAIAMIGLACVHVVLHWSWVLTVLGVARGNAAGGESRGALLRRPRVAISLACLTMVVAGVAGFWALASWQTSGTGPVGRDGQHRPSGSASINGSMSLDEVASETGLTLDEVRRCLGLAPDVSGSKHLGQLARTFNFTMDDARLRLKSAHEGDMIPRAGSAPSERGPR